MKKGEKERMIQSQTEKYKETAQQKNSRKRVYDADKDRDSDFIVVLVSRSVGQIYLSLAVSFLPSPAVQFSVHFVVKSCAAERTSPLSNARTLAWLLCVCPRARHLSFVVHAHARWCEDQPPLFSGQKRTRN